MFPFGELSHKFRLLIYMNTWDYLVIRMQNSTSSFLHYRLYDVIFWFCFQVLILYFTGPNVINYSFPVDCYTASNNFHRSVIFILFYVHFIEVSFSYPYIDAINVASLLHFPSFIYIPMSFLQLGIGIFPKGFNK